MSIDNLNDVYIDQLKDLYSANSQAFRITCELASSASDSDLKQALERGASGIEQGMSSLEKIIRGHGQEPEGEHCKGMEGLVEEARAHALEADFGDDAVRDAMVITQYQRMAHYAIAGYGCVAAFAGRLEFKSDARMIEECLDACYDGDQTMNRLAAASINEAAM